MSGAGATAALSGGPPRLRAGTLLRVFARSLVLQASWNRRGMQNLGFAFAVWPALRELYPSRAEQERALQRHLAFFNCHPYLAAAILGGALHHEERVARGEAPPETVERFKQALMGPFAAVGDAFYWLSLRPFAGAFAALLAPWLGLWSVVIFLTLFDLPHLVFRGVLFVRGYQGGDRVVETVAGARLPEWGGRLRVATAALGGVAATFSALFAAGAAYDGLSHTAHAPWAAAAAAFTFLAAYLALGRRGPVVAAWMAILFGLGLAALPPRV